MKKIIVVFAFIFVVCVICAIPQRKEVHSGGAGSNIIRFHIRANSNDAKDQYIKYVVKDKIYELISPMIGELSSSEDAIRFLTNASNVIESYANSILKSQGMVYKAKVEQGELYFEKREIDGVRIPAGYYQSMMVILGDGLGNNWWGLVYPELSFVAIDGEVSNEHIQYRSKLVEIFERM